VLCTNGDHNGGHHLASVTRCKTANSVVKQFICAKCIPFCVLTFSWRIGIDTLASSFIRMNLTFYFCSILKISTTENLAKLFYELDCVKTFSLN